MKGRILLWIAGMLVFVAVLVSILATNVYGDRGRDEINLFSIHAISVAPGDTLTQPVPLQRESPYSINVPYRWLGAGPARVEERLTASDGSLLSDTTQALTNTRAPSFPQPTYGAPLEDNASVHVIRVPSTAIGTVVLSITRLDQEARPLEFFASFKPALPNGVETGSQPGLRPTMLERPTEILALETEYGAPRPALAKAPVFVSRVQSLAPPWMPFPLPELLLVAIAAAGIYLYSRILLTPSEEPSG
jgi:hypothetical protein